MAAVGAGLHVHQMFGQVVRDGDAAFDHHDSRNDVRDDHVVEDVGESGGVGGHDGPAVAQPAGGAVVVGQHAQQWDTIGEA